MSYSHDSERWPVQKIASPDVESGKQHGPPDEEDKILAGNPGANLPAFLTRDVPGG